MKTDVENQLHIKRCSCGNLIVATVLSWQSVLGPSICHFARLGLICGKCGSLRPVPRGLPLLLANNSI